MSGSVWNTNCHLPKFEALHGTTHTDVLIIGGGLCGVLCAHFLELAGIDYLLAEANTIGSGITKNTTAKITSQHGLVYDRLIRTKGREIASLYLWANEKALSEYRSLAHRIDCDFEEKSAYTYSLLDRQKIEDEVRAVNSLGFPAEFAENVSLPFATKGAIRFPNQAQFHPLKFLAGIAEGLKIYEHTFIRDIAPHRAWSDDGEIMANKIIIATHFPFLNKHGSYFLKLYQHRSYVIALEGASDVGGMYVDEARTGMSFRNYGDLLLVGGGSHRTGRSGGNYRELREFAVAHYPDARELYCWATQDCMSLDGIPYVGAYSKRTPDLFVASGFNKWGMTGSMAAAMLLCEMAMGMKSEWSEVFSPDRSMLTPQLFANGGIALANLLTPSLKRCPHMGCALKWNAAEHTWDCPCHGSRFEGDGALIDNPATGDAKIK